MYRFGLSIPTEAFYDDETGLYLHYYDATGTVDRLSPAILRSLQSGKLIDLIGNATQAEQVQEPVVAPIDLDLGDLGVEEVIEAPVAEEPAAEPVAEEVVEEKPKKTRGGNK